MMTMLCVSVQRLREFDVYLCKKSLRKPKMIILFMDVYKVVGSTGLALGFVILAGLYPFWRVCLVSFWREHYTQEFIHDGQFWSTKIQFRWTILCLTQTDRQTDTRTHSSSLYLLR
jgi:hypothetical protein